MGLTLLDLGRVGEFGTMGGSDRLLLFHRVEVGVDLPDSVGEAGFKRRRATSLGVSDV